MPNNIDGYNNPGTPSNVKRVEQPDYNAPSTPLTPAIQPVTTISLDSNKVKPVSNDVNDTDSSITPPTQVAPVPPVPAITQPNNPSLSFPQGHIWKHSTDLQALYDNAADRIHSYLENPTLHLISGSEISYYEKELKDLKDRFSSMSSEERKLALTRIPDLTKKILKYKSMNRVIDNSLQVFDGYFYALANETPPYFLSTPAMKDLLLERALKLNLGINAFIDCLSGSNSSVNLTPDLRSNQNSANRGDSLRKYSSIYSLHGDSAAIVMNVRPLPHNMNVDQYDVTAQARFDIHVAQLDSNKKYNLSDPRSLSFRFDLARHNYGFPNSIIMDLEGLYDLDCKVNSTSGKITQIPGEGEQYGHHFLIDQALTRNNSRLDDQVLTSHPRFITNYRKFATEFFTLLESRFATNVAQR